MKPFLQQLADELFLTYGKNISNLCLVFPNRRAGLYFRKYLALHLQKPLWSPEVFAIEDFVALKSGLTIAGQPALLINLYKLYYNDFGDKARPLKDFITWGNRLLSDFDEIDQHLIDGTSVFSYLTDARAIEHWNPDGKPLTDFEKSYLEFYKSLAPLYAQFRAELITNGQAYMGLAFRRLIENLDNTSFDEWHRVIFAGFNALTPVEERLFSTLKNAGKAELYWDADSYYLDDGSHEAGLFMRKYRDNNQFGPISWISDFYKNSNRQIHITGIPKNIGQAKFAGQLLDSLDKEKAGSIAVVLVDEGLLIPVLNSIPASISDFNVTMGFSMKLTPAYSLIDTVLNLVINSQKYGTTRDGNTVCRYYRDDILRLLKHPYLSGRRPLRGNATFDEAKELSRSFYQGLDFLKILHNYDDLLGDAFEPFISGENNATNLLTLLQRIIVLVKVTSEEGNDRSETAVSPSSGIETEFLFGIADIIHDLQLLMGELSQLPDFVTLHALFTNLAGTMRLPFYGEPLKGIQVMGVLETRTLDFDTLIMVSVNEGLLPKGKRQDSFIPVDIRQEFGLPGYREHNAVFAYHFYRLLQRAKTAWLLYNTEADEMGNGEKSRFITQLLYELPIYNPEAVILEQVVGSVSVANAPPVITIPKTQSAVQRLKEIAISGFSPSLLSSYLNCSLQFYFSAILGLQEPDAVEETIDASMLGNAVHSVFQKVFQPYLGKTMDADDIRSLLEPATALVREELCRQFPGSDLDTGKNLIIVNVARNMVRGFLETEAEQLLRAKVLLKILHLEDKFWGRVNIPIGDNEEVLEIAIKGTTDRVDLFGNQLRIVDYKTGSLQSSELSLDDPGDLALMKKPQKMLQLLCYAWLYSQNHPAEAEFVSGIVSLKTPRRYLQKAKIRKSEMLNTDILSRFEEYLTNLLAEIFDPATHFQQTENQDNCTYCPFISICNR